MYSEETSPNVNETSPLENAFGILARIIARDVVSHRKTIIEESGGEDGEKHGLQNE